MKYLLLLLPFCSLDAFAQIDTLVCNYYITDYEYRIDINAKDLDNIKSTYIYTEGPNKGKALSKKIVKKIKISDSNPDMSTCTPCYWIVKDQYGIQFKGDFYTDCCVGEYVRYHRNGNISESGRYTSLIGGQVDTINACQKNGEWKYFDENGKLIKTELFEKGKSIKVYNTVYGK